MDFDPRRSAFVLWNGDGKVWYLKPPAFGSGLHGHGLDGRTGAGLRRRRPCSHQYHRRAGQVEISAQPRRDAGSGSRPRGPGLGLQTHRLASPLSSRRSAATDIPSPAQIESRSCAIPRAARKIRPRRRRFRGDACDYCCVLRRQLALPAPRARQRVLEHAVVVVAATRGAVAQESRRLVAPGEPAEIEQSRASRYPALRRALRSKGPGCEVRPRCPRPRLR